MASRLRIESHSATPSPTLILDTPADFQLIVFPLGVKVRFAYPFNSEQYGRVRIEETKRRRARQDRPRLRSRLQESGSTTIKPQWRSSSKMRARRLPPGACRDRSGARQAYSHRKGIRVPDVGV